MNVRTLAIIPAVALLVSTPLPAAQVDPSANDSQKVVWSYVRPPKTTPPKPLKRPVKARRGLVEPSRFSRRVPYATPQYNRLWARWYIANKYRWQTKQYGCLSTLWGRESGWKVHAGSKQGAYGIPQSLPGYKMRSMGPNWVHDPRTQIKWGAKYIHDRYGTPCRALNHSYRYGWY